jgi:hypothetical protein
MQPQAELSDPRSASFVQRGIKHLTPPRLFWITFACGLIVFCLLQFWKLPSTKDRANWDYFAQVISRGGVPYRDVVNIKTPLSAYIGAAAIVATRPFGLSPVIATRTTFVCLSALTVAFTFLVATLYFGGRRIGLLAAMILCGIFLFGRLSSDGIQPKLPMVLFGLISLWATIRGHPVRAGMFGMLSALSWQPGLLFVGTSGLAFTRYLTSWRDGKWAKVILGAAIPLAPFLAHLLIGGSLRDFYLWCFRFNVEVYAPYDFSTYGSFVKHFTMLVDKSYNEDRGYFQLAASGTVLAAAREVYLGIKRGRVELQHRAPYHQVIIAPIVYLIFCRINMQGEQDLIPLLPFIGIFAAFVLLSVIDGIIGLFGQLSPRVNVSRLELMMGGVLLIVVFVVSVRPDFSFAIGRRNLVNQQADAAEVMSLLQPGDEIWVHGQTEMLVISGLTNSHKYTNLDHGKDNYLDRVEAGGFQAWFEKLKSDRPRVVMFTRTKRVARKREFLDWLKQDYDRRRGKLFTYYVRKEQ